MGDFFGNTCRIRAVLFLYVEQCSIPLELHVHICINDYKIEEGIALDKALSVHVKDIRKSFGSTEVLKGITADVKPGEFLTLLGPSGCGKTTLLRIIAGFIKPDSGSIHIGDTNISNVPSYLRGLGMVFQNYALWPHMTVKEHLTFGLKLSNIDSDTMQKRVTWALELVGLTGFEERRPTELSGGQQQRVALARAIALQPKILLLDEPLSNLDRKLRDGMRVELRILQERLGITTIYVTHDQQEALAMSDRILVLNRGKIEQMSGPKELYDSPNSAFVANFVGHANLIPVTILERTKNTVVLEIASSKISVPVNNPSFGYSSGILVIRPENIAFTNQTTGVNPMFTGRIENTVYEGKELRCSIRIKETKTSLSVICPSTTQIHPGEQVGLTILNSTLVPAEGED